MTSKTLNDPIESRPETTGGKICTEIPNETTLRAFAEDKRDIPVFHTADELRKDLLS